MKTVEGRKLLQAQLDKQTLSDLEASSRAEQIAKTWENMKEQLADMLTNTILPMVDQVMNWLKSSVNIQKVADGIKTAFGYIQRIISNLPSILNAAITVAKVLASISIGRAVASVVGGLAMGGPAGVIAGLAAGALAYTWLSSMIPDMGGSAGGAPAVAPIASAAPISSGASSGNIAPANTAYTPPAENAVAGGRSSNTSGADITANLVVDGNVLASTMVKYLPQNAGANGDSRTSKT
jgi:hypothetical protein